MHLNLYIVDDDEALRSSLAGLLTAHFNEFSVRTFASGEEFLERADLASDGVVFMDLRMEPGISGLEVFKRMQDRQSPLVTIFLSGHGTIPDAVQAMEGGAVSWLPKPSSNEELLAVVRRARDRAAAMALQHNRRKNALELWATLSAREKQIVWPLVDGQSAKQIARALSKTGPGVTHRTIEGHRGNLLSKLDINKNSLQKFLRENDLLDEALAAYAQPAKR